MLAGNRVVVHQAVNKNRTSPSTPSKHAFGAEPNKLQQVGASRKERLSRERKSLDGKAPQIDALFEQRFSNKAKLDTGQLKELMMGFGKIIGNNYVAGEADVDDLMKLCDRDKSGDLDQSEAEWAMNVWQRHLKVLPDIAPYFEKYDKDKSGRLDKNELKELLTELNDHIQVHDVDVLMVLANADTIADGKIGGLEMKRAIAYWYTHMEEELKEKQAHAANSVCCILQ